MAQAKKSASKNTNSDQVEARPIGEGKDPLAEGNTLHNPSNTEAETHYDVAERSEDVQAQEAQNKIDGQDANERAEEHNAQAVAATTPDGSTEDQDEAADDSDREGR